jgi:hypothetical protein
LSICPGWPRNNAQSVCTDMIDLNFLQLCGDPPQLKFITPE